MVASGCHGCMARAGLFCLSLFKPCIHVDQTPGGTRCSCHRCEDEKIDQRIDPLVESVDCSDALRLAQISIHINLIADRSCQWDTAHIQSRANCDRGTWVASLFGLSWLPLLARVIDGIVEKVMDLDLLLDVEERRRRRIRSPLSGLLIDHSFFPPFVLVIRLRHGFKCESSPAHASHPANHRETNFSRSENCG